MECYKKKWLFWFLVHLLVPIVVYSFAFLLMKVTVFSFILLIISTIVNFAITMYFSYINKGIKWLLWILILHMVSIPTSIVQLLWVSVKTGGLSMSDINASLVFFSFPFIYYSYKLRESYKENILNLSINI